MNCKACNVSLKYNILDVAVSNFENNNDNNNLDSVFFNGAYYCYSCFLNLLIKKVRRNLRKSLENFSFNIKKDLSSVFFLLSDNSSGFMLRDIFSDMIEKSSKDISFSKIVISDLTADQIEILFLKYIFNKGKFPKNLFSLLNDYYSLDGNFKFILPLFNVSLFDSNKYCEIKKISYLSDNIILDEVDTFFDDLLKTYPSILYSFSNSIVELFKRIES